MNSQCIECGSFISSNGMKNHLKTSKCLKSQSFNNSFRFMCRKCNYCFDKKWHAESHICDGVPVYSKDIEELKLKCDFYKSFILAMGINLDIDWEKAQNGEIVLPIPPKVYLKYDSPDNSENESESDNSDNESESSDNSDNEELKELPLLNQSPSEIIQKVQMDNFEDCLTSINGLISLLLKKEIRSADGENRYYILGVKLAEIVSNNYSNTPEHRFISMFSNIKKLSIKNMIQEREEFTNGIKDSFCEKGVEFYILFNLDIISCDLVYENLHKVESSYTLMNAMRPIEEYIDEIITPKYHHLNGKFYNENGNPEPWLLKVTEDLCNLILDISIPIFKNVYKYTYGNNKYCDDWKSNTFLKQFTPMFRNIELASTIFDLNHILRKKILRKPENKEIVEVSIPQFDKDEWDLISTRVHYGVIPFDIGNFFESVFDSSTTQEVSAKWLKKYILGIKCFSNEYPASIRYKTQVIGEKSNRNGVNVV